MMAGEDLQFLSTVAYFQGLSPSELAQIYEHCRQRILQVGEIVVLEGQPTDALYIVRRGRIRAYRTSDDGKEQVIFDHGPGATFNDVAVFDGGPALATAEALAPNTRICVVPARLMHALLATNPRVAANVVRVLPECVRQLTSLVEELSFHHIVQRVARLLLEEYETTGQITLTKHEMAARVGTVREAVSRTLHDLEQRGAITRQHHRIVRIDVPTLRALLGTTPATMERTPQCQFVARTPQGPGALSLARCG